MRFISILTHHPKNRLPTEAVEYTRKFLDQVGLETVEGTWEGAWETCQLFEMPSEEDASPPPG